MAQLSSSLICVKTPVQDRFALRFYFPETLSGQRKKGINVSRLTRFDCINPLQPVCDLLCGL